MTAQTLIQIALMVAVAKLVGEVCERWLKQPAVLGELLGGVLIGRSMLGLVPASDPILHQMAELGAVFLLFEVGLECDMQSLLRVGGSAFYVAVAGVVLPFALGASAAHLLGMGGVQAIFVGAALTATSVGITARVFADLKCLHTKEARIVLGAAVADDVIGLVILAAVSGLAAAHTISAGSVARLALVACGFLGAAIVAGRLATPRLLSLARRMRTRGALPTASIAFCLVLAAGAAGAGLAPIVGAFTAGLVLAPTEHRMHFEPQVKAIADLLVPLFFVMMGAQMNLQSLNPMTDAGRASLGVGGALLLAAVVGKVVAGLTCPGRGLRRATIAIGMLPRGEVGLIFAGIGLQTAVIGDSLYAAIVFVVIATTLVTPPLLAIANRAARLPVGPLAQPAAGKASEARV
jgi:Kef-type K+ transport system membrane component KefB